MNEKIEELLNRVSSETNQYTQDELIDLINNATEWSVLKDNIVDKIFGCKLDKKIQHKLIKMVAKKAGISVRVLLQEKEKNTPNKEENPDDFIKEINSSHAVVKVGGKVYVMNEEHDPQLNRNLLTFSPWKDFVLWYQDRKTVEDGVEISIGEHWLNSPKRRKYEGLVFAPGKDVNGYYNLFQGFAVKPRKGGSCGLFCDFMQEIICSGSIEIYDYLWKWLAHLFQYPDDLPEVAIILRGEQGIGKNTFVDAIGHLVGASHYMPVSGLGQISGRFSGHLASALLVFANEAVWGGNKEGVGKIKEMVTDPISTIEYKGKEPITVRNFKRLIVASNELWAMPRDWDDRRCVVLDVSPSKKGDFDYFAGISNQLNNGGYEALMQELLEVPLDGWHPRQKPSDTNELGWDIKMYGDTILQFWFHCLEKGYIIKNTDYISNWQLIVPKLKVYESYLEWCEPRRINHPVNDIHFGRTLSRIGINPSRIRYGEERIYCYKFNQLDQERESFSKLLGIPIEHWNGSDKVS